MDAGYFLPGVWGLSPSFKKSPKIGGYRGLIKTISIVIASEARQSQEYRGVNIAMTVLERESRGKFPLVGVWG
jgi:hypothetical protein